MATEHASSCATGKYDHDVETKSRGYKVLNISYKLFGDISQKKIVLFG